MKNVFATRWGIIVVGIVIGILASLLQLWGNPANMGICVACFIRDITGALGLHRAPVVQYLRPEIIGFVLGSLWHRTRLKNSGRGWVQLQLYAFYWALSL